MSGLVHTLKRAGYKALVRLRRRAPLEVAGMTGQFRIACRKDYSHVAGGHFEREPLEAFIELLRADDVVYEVGGHIGTWTIFLSQRARELHVFEPDESNRASLIANIALNNLTNVHVHAYAVSNENGTAQFGVVDRRSDGRHSLHIGPQHRRVVEVETMRLDDLPQHLNAPPPTALKVDVEGAETLVMEGGQRVVHESVRVLFLEVHQQVSDEWREKQIAALTADGFSVRANWGRGGEHQIILSR